MHETSLFRCNQQELNELNRQLYEHIENDGRYHLTVSEVKEIYFLRLSTGSINNTPEVTQQCFNVIQEMTSKLLHPTN